MTGGQIAHGIGVAKARSDNEDLPFATNGQKPEIFDRFDFCYFYIIKPIWVGDFGAQI